MSIIANINILYNNIIMSNILIMSINVNVY